MLRNVIIINDFAYVQGGASKVAIDTANILAEKKYNVWFFTGATDITTKKSLNKKVKIISTEQGEAMLDRNRLRGIKNGIYNRKANRKLAELLKSLNSGETIVHVHGWTKCLSASIFRPIFKRNFKLVLTLHDYFTSCPNGGFFNYKKNQICTLCPMSAKCIKTNCDSRNYGFKIYRVIRQFVQNKVVGLPKKLEYIIYLSDLQWDVLKGNFENLKYKKKILNPMDFKVSKTGKKNKDGYYLYVGRLSQEKGIKIFCEALSQVGYPAIVVGDGPLFDELSNEYSTIKFVGWKDSEDVKRYMQDAKALVFPSLWYEGQPLVPMEAESLGIACIVSDKSSAKEFVKNKDFVYDGGNVESLKGMVERFNFCYNRIKIEPGNIRNQYSKEVISFYELCMEKK